MPVPAASAGVDHEFRMDNDVTLQAHEQEALDRRYIPAIVAGRQLAGVPIEVDTT